MGKVIQLAPKLKEITQEEHEDCTSTGKEGAQDDKEKGFFDKVCEQNVANEERIERERAQKNKNILRSYRIK